ncbi:MAG: aspartate-semialdehyde dehydrogenase [Bacteroidetes bacterium]|nr:aspartate-semialdehyde dehydrogenase [Bacteroidota bacterium]
MKVAVVGATGLVGSKMLEILAERNFPVSELIPVASERSAGKIIIWNNKEYKIVTPGTAISMQPDIALFSAGGNTSLQWAEKFAATGCVVIDNSSAWRMDNSKKLIVPEVNGETIEPGDIIIANPNCSTIQMVMVLNPLNKKNKIKRVVVSTYQSVTGTGTKAVEQLMNERGGITGEMAYYYPIDLNAIPHIDKFEDNGYTKEEMKMVNETRKILNDYSIQVSATCVRIAAIGGHSESVNIEFENDISAQEFVGIIRDEPGIKIVDDVKNNIYPMPLFAQNKDDVFVGRIRKDISQPNTINCWIVSDNLRKGAATNAIQIAELMLKRNLI